MFRGVNVLNGSIQSPIPSIYFHQEASRGISSHSGYFCLLRNYSQGNPDTWQVLRVYRVLYRYMYPRY